MNNRSIYFGNPAYLSVKNDQLMFDYRGEEVKKSVPTEDVGVLIIDHFS